MLNETHLSELTEEFDHTTLELRALLLEMESLQTDSTMNVDEDSSTAIAQRQQDDIMSIHFDFESPQRTNSERLIYSWYLCADLRLRNMSVLGPTLSLRERLRAQLLMEYKYWQLKESIQHGRPISADAFLFHMDVVPCILHLENRVSLKIFQMLMKAGIDEDWKKNHTKVATGKFIDSMEEVVNKVILGAADAPSHWKCPCNKEGEIGQITMYNWNMRILIENFGLLVDKAIEKDEDRLRWKTLTT